MKVICDEGVPRALGRRLQALGINVSSPAREWRGLSNGRLIATGTAASFDVLLSNDKTIAFQLNLATLEIGIVTLPNNRRHSLVPSSEDIADTVRRALPGQHVAIESDGRRVVRRWDAGGGIVVVAMEPVAPFDP